MRLKGHKRGHGISWNLKVMVKSLMKLFDMAIMVKKFHVIRTCLFPHSFINVDLKSE